MGDIIHQGGQYSLVNIVLGGHYSLVNNVRGLGGTILTITPSILHDSSRGHLWGSGTYATVKTC